MASKVHSRFYRLNIFSLNWSITYLSAFLVSGYSDGTVALNVCTIDQESGNIDFKGDLTLWKEQDYAIAENMKIRVDKERAILVLSKEQWLLVFNLDDEVTVQQFSFDKRIAGKFKFLRCVISFVFILLTLLFFRFGNHEWFFYIRHASEFQVLSRGTFQRCKRTHFVQLTDER